MHTVEEWQTVLPFFSNGVAQIKAYKELHGCSVVEATSKGFGWVALEAYEKITSFKETNANALFHHRLSLSGPPCRSCGKPLRTPQARSCRACNCERASDIKGVACS
jgi:hypothetical protein